LSFIGGQQKETGKDGKLKRKKKGKLIFAKYVYNQSFIEYSGSGNGG
jgi:hypothetical protein